MLDAFRSDLVASTPYTGWKRANPGEARLLEAYMADPSYLTHPMLLTRFGKAQVVAATAIAELEAIDAPPTAPAPEPAPPPAPAPSPPLQPVQAASVFDGAIAWVGNLHNVPGDLASLIPVLVREGFTAVGIKAHHGTDVTSHEARLEAAIAEVRKAGLKVILWGWNGDGDPVAEAEKAAAYAQFADGYACNYEGARDLQENWSERWTSTYARSGVGKPLALFTLGGASIPTGQRFTPFEQPVAHPIWVRRGAHLIPEAFWAPSNSKEARDAGAAAEYRPSNCVHHATVKAGFDPAKVHVCFASWGAPYLASPDEQVTDLVGAVQRGEVPATRGLSVYLADQCDWTNPAWAVFGRAYRTHFKP